MSWMVVDCVRRRTRATQGDKFVLLEIAHVANADGTGAWASNEHLMRVTGYKRRAIFYILKKLEAAHEIRCRKNTERLSPARANGHIPDRFIDILCVCEWDRYQGNASAKFALKDGGAVQTLQSRSAKFDTVRVQSLHSPNKVDPVVDPVVDPKAVKAAPLPRRHACLEDNEATYGLLQTFAHKELDSGDGFESYAGFSDAVKTSASRAGVTFQPALLSKAIASVLLTRGVDERQRRAIK